MKSFDVTFNTGDKYNSCDRTVRISTDNRYAAKKLVVAQCGKKIRVLLVKESAKESTPQKCEERK